MKQRDPLLAGFFPVARAARLVGRSPATVRRWAGVDRRDGALIERDFDDAETIGFLDLIELRAIAVLRDRGVRPATLRRAGERMRRELDARHPWALSPAAAGPRREEAVRAAALAEGDRRARDLVEGRRGTWAEVEREIAEGVAFEAETGLALSWTPEPARFPDVRVDPRYAFGKPTVAYCSVPTETLFLQWKAEGCEQRVADWYCVPVDAVKVAIEYEDRS